MDGGAASASNAATLASSASACARAFDQVQPPHRLIHPGPYHRGQLLPQPGKGRDGAAGNPGKVIKKLRAFDHLCSLSFSD
jgi:hypothetical protein